MHTYNIDQLTKISFKDKAIIHGQLKQASFLPFTIKISYCPYRKVDLFRAFFFIFKPHWMQSYHDSGYQDMINLLDQCKT